MALPVDPMITFRPVRFVDDGVHPDDLETAVRLQAASDLAALGSIEVGQGEVSEVFLMPTAAREITGFLEVDGEPLGMIAAENDATALQTFLIVAVPPGPSSRQVRDRGIELAIAAARGHMEAAGASAWTLRCGHWKGLTEAEESLAAHGFIPVRQFHRMRIDSTSPVIPRDAPPLPEGVELVVARTEDEYREVHFVDNDAFLDHWNFTPRDWDEWWDFFSSSPSRDPEGWWLLRVGGEPAAIAIMEETRAEFNDGYIGILAVRRPFRGRGLAQLLLQRAFIRYREMGRLGTQLGVDADNTTGAVRLYEKVGMSPVRTVQGWALELD